MLKNQKKNTKKTLPPLLEKLSQLSDHRRFQIVGISGIIQAGFSLAVMIYLRILPLIFLCSFGIFLFIFSVKYANKNNLPNIFVAVSLYGIASLLTAAFLLEWDFGFQNYLFALIPISYTFLYTESQIYHKTIYTSFTALLFFFAEYLICLFINRTVLPVTHATTTFIVLVQAINALLIMLLLFIFVLMFIIRLNRANLKILETSRQLDLAANTDALTGLYNRRFIRKVFDDLSKNQASFFLIICDIDHFKCINDTYGHDTGDSVLQAVTKKIKEQISESDYAVRWGGEEFLLLLTNVSPEYIDAVTQKLIQSIRDLQIPFNDTTITCTITAGGALHTNIKAINETVKLADENLYYGKANGRNCYIENFQKKQG